MNNSDAASPPPINSQPPSNLNTQFTPPSHYYGSSQQQVMQHHHLPQQHPAHPPSVNYDITNLYNGLTQAELRITDLTRRVTDLETISTTMQNEMQNLMQLCVDINGNIDLPERFTFDPTNITNDAATYTTDVDFHDGQSRPVNVYDIASQCKEFKRTKDIKNISKLYKSIMKKIYGDKDIKNYTSSSKRSLKSTSCSNVVIIIENLISNGYITDTTTQPETAFIKDIVAKVIAKCNTYVFTNARRKARGVKRTKKQKKLSRIVIRESSASSSSSPVKPKPKKKRSKRNPSAE